MKLFETSTKRNGFKEIKFSSIETFRILRDELEFGYVIEDKKKHLYKRKDGDRTIVQFNDLSNAFREYLKENYNSLENPDSVSLEDLIEATWSGSPIFISNSALRRYLIEDNLF